MRRSDLLRTTLGFLLAPLLALVVGSMPLPGLTLEAHRLAAISVFVIVLWLTEALPLPVTALLGAALCVVAGIAPASQVLAAFGDPVIFLFLGSFLLARALEIHGVDRRISYSLLSHPWVSGSTLRTLWALGLTTAVLSMWISNTACVAMLFPVVLAIGRATEEQLGHPAPRFVTGLLLMLAYSASIGGLGTPVGTPPNMIGIALIEKGTGVHIDFFRWMLFAVPLTLLLFVALFLVVRLLFPPEVKQIPGQLDSMRRAVRELGPLRAGERNALLAFGTAIFLWLLPGIVSGILGTEHPGAKAFSQRMPEGVAAILAASLLFVLPVSRREWRPTLQWSDAVAVDWGTILLFGGGIALGKLSFETGLAEAMGKGLVSALGISQAWTLQGAATGIAVLVSETSSNTASANMVVPVMLSMAESVGASAAVTGVAATLGASLGFMLPISTPPNAIVYGSGRIRLADMVKAGILLDLVGGLLVWIAVMTWVRVLLPA